MADKQEHPRTHTPRLGGPMAAHFTRSQILRASTEVFARLGIPATRVEDLLQAAGISRRTFYKYFKNKDELLTALYDLSTETLLNSIREAVDGAEDIKGKLATGIEAYLEYHATSGPLLRVIQQEAVRSESPLAPGREQAQLAVVELFDEQVQKTQGRRLDRLVFVALCTALEGLSMFLLTKTTCSAADLDRVKRVMNGIIEHVLARPGEEITPLPGRDEPNTPVDSGPEP